MADWEQRLKVVAAAIGVLAAIVALPVIKDCGVKPPEDRKFIGRVTGTTTHRPIQGAKVSLEGEGVPPVLYTDSEGIFFFPLKGTTAAIRVRVDAAQYAPFDRRISPSGKTEPEDIRLEPQK